ncbi:MAG: NlpC/P60 family protein [Cyanobacteria bacterium P01_D01_bin.36]
MAIAGIAKTLLINSAKRTTKRAARKAITAPIEKTADPVIDITGQIFSIVLEGAMWWAAFSGVWLIDAMSSAGGLPWAALKLFINNHGDLREQVIPGDVGRNFAGSQLVESAKAWAGKPFKPGQIARCADFIREVLRERGITLKVPSGSAGPLMADSFYAPEEGEIILDKNQLQPGDIVMFHSTYNGPGRIIDEVNPNVKITHVGIYVGEGMMVDRPTASRPVQHRPISTFQFHSALRPHAYNQAQASPIEGDRLACAIGNAEGTRTPDCGFTAAYTSHQDPGNGKTNQGSFSYQHGAASAEEADQKWLATLEQAKQSINEQAVAKFGSPLSEAAMVIALDAYTQSPNAGKDYFVGHLVSHDPTPEQLKNARIAALNSSRAERGGPPMNVAADQRRRVNAALNVVQ